MARRNVINVLRPNMLEGTLRAFQRKAFDPKALLDVHFMGEFGVDQGGPARELMTLVTRNIPAMGIFSGPEKLKGITMDQNGRLPVSAISFKMLVFGGV